MEAWVSSSTYTLSRDDGLELETKLYIERDKSLSTVMYPYMDLDGATHLFCSLGARIPLGQQWVVKAGVLGGGGAYSEQFSKSVDDSVGISTTPYRLTEWWDLEQEVSDVFRLDLSLALRYTLRRLPLYIEAGCDYTHAFNVMLAPGTNRQTSYITIGYKY